MKGEAFLLNEGLPSIKMVLRTLLPNTEQVSFHCSLLRMT